MPEIISTLTPATHSGLLGICLSGAGPTILALHTHGHESIANGITEIFNKHNVNCKLEVVSLSEEGSTVEYN